LISIGSVSSKDKGQDFLHTLALNANYQKVIADEWHLALFSRFSHVLDNNSNYNISFDSRLTWMPSARTQVQGEFGFTKSKSDFGTIVPLIFRSFETKIAGEYFVSTNLSIFGSISYSNLNYMDPPIQSFDDSYSLGTNFGLRYYFI